MTGEGHADLERAVTIALAGPLGERRARRGSSPGWHRARTRPELIAHHEGAHAVVSHQMGKPVRFLSVIPTGVSLGVCVCGGEDLSASAIAEIRARPSATDEDFALELSRGLPGPRWRNLRRLYRQTLAILESRWPAVIELAERLQARGELYGSEITEILSIY